MALSEFNLIKRYFSTGICQRDDVRLGVGDDAALVVAPADQSLAMSIDTLVAGVHFPDSTSAENIGYKALAVNLSDLAAMGATPAWAMLALTLTETDEDWLEGFYRGFSELASCFNVSLIGGDTTSGPLTITVQVSGFVPELQALRRGGAHAGDLVYVTGQLGDAGLGLQLKDAALDLSEPRKAYFVNRLERPQPRVDVGLALRGIASAAIDISDGLAADLGHILEASGVGANLNVDSLPVAEEIKSMFPDQWWSLPLSSGDDYELCFCLPPDRLDALQQALKEIDIAVTCIGSIEATSGLRLRREDGSQVALKTKGYEHFG